MRLTSAEKRLLAAVEGRKTITQARIEEYPDEAFEVLGPNEYVAACSKCSRMLGTVDLSAADRNTNQFRGGIWYQPCPNGGNC